MLNYMLKTAYNTNRIFLQVTSIFYDTSCHNYDCFLACYSLWDYNNHEKNIFPGNLLFPIVIYC